MLAGGERLKYDAAQNLINSLTEKVNNELFTYEERPATVEELEQAAANRARRAKERELREYAELRHKAGRQSPFADYE